MGYETPFWSLWGQFLRGGFRFDHAKGAAFRAAFAAAGNPETCLRSFPYEVLRPECAIRSFYAFYDVGG